MKKVEISGENYEKQQVISSEIRRLLLEIQDDTGMFSTHNHIYEHENFPKLVAMGDRIIPYLFHIVMHYGGSWLIFILLKEITKENPVKKGDWCRYPKVMIAWIQWWVDSKYYHTDVYYGLVENEDGELPIFEKCE
jgi:hypothetical protein